MKKEFNTSFIVLLTLLATALFCGNGFSGNLLFASPEIVAKLRLYEGIKAGSPPPAEVVSSYHLKRIDKNDVTSDQNMDKEVQTLRKIFNLTEIKLISSAGLQFEEGKEHGAAHVIMLNGKKLQVRLTSPEKNSDHFNVTVEALEKNGESPSLLETTLKLPQTRTTVLGFEDSTGRNYFLSFHRGVNAVTPAKESGNDVEHVPSNKKPKLLKNVQPIYPEEAMKQHISGNVTIDAITDINGRVSDAVVHSGHPLLNGAALDAVRQWVYEPFVNEKGKVCPVKFTVLIKFNLADDKDKKPLNLTDEQKPRAKKKVNPVYPKKALKEHLQGLVLLELVVDSRGYVADVNVTEGSPELAPAAVEAVKQWVFEPYIINNLPHPVRFSVVVKFELNKDGDTSKSNANAIMLSASEKPKLISSVPPVYPKEALKKHICGDVALEVRVDPTGAVTEAKVMEGPEELRAAAIEALKKWRYEVYKKDGKPVSVRFTVLMKFSLKKD